MFLKKISVTNYKLFSQEFIIDNFNIPDGTNRGTGLTLIVGENGCGKTTILDSIAISMLDYKADTFNIHDFNDLNKDVSINFQDKRMRNYAFFLIYYYQRINWVVIKWRKNVKN